MSVGKRNERRGSSHSQSFFEAQSPVSLGTSQSTEAIELGLRFRSLQPGAISEIRIHRTVDSVDGYRVHLWTADGALLASGHAPGGHLGWLSAPLSSPVLLTPHQLYIASYHAPAGRFDHVTGGLRHERTVGPLQAPAGASVGGNGVYAFGPPGTFPAQSLLDTDYLVDVRLLTTIAGHEGASSAVSSLLGAETPASMSTTQSTEAIELGLKFRPHLRGVVRAIRFHRTVDSADGYRVHLWTADGALLASGHAPGGRPGWLSAPLSSPVLLTPHQLYIASYHAPTGRFDHVTGGLRHERTVGPLQAPAGASSGGNGVYAFGPPGTFPSQSLLDTDYLVDVEFTPQ